MTLESIMAELRAKGSEATKKIYLKHGIKEPFFGVNISELKVIQKKIKKNYSLSKALYATGNADAMYLAGLIADEKLMTKKDLNVWVSEATSTNIYSYTVPWIAAESNFGYEIGIEWIDHKRAITAAAGWYTLSFIAALKADEDLDISNLKKLLSRVGEEIHAADNCVRQAMNAFIISIGSYVPSLTENAIKISNKIGLVHVDVGDTACKVPLASDYINKVKDRGALGKKKKTVRC